MAHRSKNDPYVQKVCYNQKIKRLSTIECVGLKITNQF